MVAQTDPPSSRPFGLRALLYTVGFLVFILGVVPSVFYLLGERPFRSLDWPGEIRFFWTEFRRLVGLAIFSAGLVAYALCSAWLIYFGRGPHVEFDPPRVFVASGPYRWVRNPVAACLVVAVFGQAVYFASAGLLVLVAVGMLFAHVQVTRIEEPRLRIRFGDSYEDYCRRVPRWLPRPPAPDAPGP